jgi:2-polyprenyl-6-methoxyphenol hydroxylase-like FAD-dependent oxidoreductase
MHAVAPADASSSPREIEVDVAVIGAGTAGTAAAAAIHTAGYRVALIDLHRIYPDEFRAEKFGQSQFAYFEKFGLGLEAREALTRFDDVWVYNYGRVVERKQKVDYSVSYGDFVNGLRRGLPAGVEFLIGKIETLETGAEGQLLAMADGAVIRSRLVVVATGQVDIVRRGLGIEKQVISAAHSLTFGFDLEQTPDAFPFASLVWYPDRPADRGAYLSLFPIGGRMRGNLFTYKSMSDPWVKAFRLDPSGELARLLPKLGRLFGPVTIAGKVAARPIDLAVSTNHLQPGVVLLGDAYMTTCPTTGTGLERALGDVDTLIGRLPDWLATPGMGIDKLGQFYNDPAKLQRDGAAMRSSLRDRDMRLNVGLVGRARRLRSIIEVRGGYELDGLKRVVRRATGR